MIKDIKLIESVQRRFTKRIPGLRSLSYDERLHVLGIPTLEDRRLQHDLVTFFKILNGTISTSLKSQIRDARSQSRGHPLRKMVIGASADMYKHSFIPRSIPIWNSLRADIVCSATALEFASRLAQSGVQQFKRGGNGPSC